MRASLLFVVVACTPTPKYLGTEVPKPCTTRDAEGCLGWMMERDLLAAELGIYDDARLRGYVQRVVEKLARANHMGATPRVMIADSDETYATAGRRIVIARTTIEKLETEAELAGILAHELAHIEGRHVMVSLFGRPESDNTTNRKDAEAIADERAVAILETAGYAPTAMATALTAVLEADDDEHPAREDRIARVTKLAGGRGGFEGRAELLANLDGMVIGDDPRLGLRAGDAWIVPALGVAFDLDADDDVITDDEILAVKRGRSSVVAYAVGAPWAREIATTFDDPVVIRSPLGRVTHGRVKPAADHADSPFAKLAHAIRKTLPQPDPGTHVAVLEGRRGALVVELGGRAAPDLKLRLATEAELAASQPDRISIENAPRDGSLRVLNVCAGRLLERADRTVEAGDPVKCARRSDRQTAAR